MLGSILPVFGWCSTRSAFLVAVTTEKTGYAVRGWHTRRVMVLVDRYA